MSNINEEKTNIGNNISFLLRGCPLKKTKSVFCFVAYARINTKIMQHSHDAKAKTSSNENRMNQQIKT